MSTTLGDLNVRLLLEVVEADKNAKKFNETLKETDKQATKAQQSTKNLNSSVNDLSGGFSLFGIGAAAAVAGLVAFAKEALIAGAELTVLRSSFQGSEEDLELFRQATARTVSDGDLIKLSNYASDLGVALKDQAQLFSLAEDSADKYGGSVQDNFSRVIQATDGSARGLRSVGISTKAFEDEVARLTDSMGLKLDAMSADEQLNVRLQAIYNLTGSSLDTVRSKTMDVADTLGNLQLSFQNYAGAVGETIFKYADLDKAQKDFASSAKDAGAKTGDFIGSLVELGTWIQKYEGWINPGVGALKQLYEWTKNATEATLELIGVRSQVGTDTPGPKSLDERVKDAIKTIDDKTVNTINVTADYIEPKVSRKSTGSTNTTGKDPVAYLQELATALAEVEAQIGRQTSAESEAQGLFLKKQDLELLIQYINNLEAYKIVSGEASNVASDNITDTLGAYDTFFFEIQELIRKDAESKRELSETYGKVVSDLQTAASFVSQINSTLGESGRNFLFYMNKALEAAIQIAQYIGKSKSEGGASFLDFLPIIGTLFSAIPFATGGPVPGRGSGDTVPAMLTPGEYVVNKSRASKLGSQFLNWLNGGGSVMPLLGPAGSGGSGGAVIINMGSGLSDLVKAEIVQQGSRVMDVRINNSRY